MARIPKSIPKGGVGAAFRAAALAYLLGSLSWFAVNVLHESGHLLAAILVKAELSGHELTVGPLGGHVASAVRSGPELRFAVAAGVVAPIAAGCLAALLSRRLGFGLFRAFLAGIPAIALLQIGLVLLLSTATGRLMSGDLHVLLESGTPLLGRGGWALAGAASSLVAIGWVVREFRGALGKQILPPTQRRWPEVGGVMAGMLAVPAAVFLLKVWVKTSPFIALAHDLPPSIGRMGVHLAFSVLGAAFYVAGWIARSASVRRMAVVYLLAMNAGQVAHHQGISTGGSTGIRWDPETAAAEGDPFAKLVVDAEHAESRRDYREAGRLWKAAHDASPSQVYLRVRLGRALYLSGSKTEAEQVLKRALDSSLLTPLHAGRIAHWLGRIALDRGDEGAACGHLRRQEAFQLANDELTEDPAAFLASLPDCGDE